MSDVVNTPEVVQNEGELGQEANPVVNDANLGESLPKEIMTLNLCKEFPMIPLTKKEDLYKNMANSLNKQTAVVLEKYLKKLEKNPEQVLTGPFKAEDVRMLILKVAEDMINLLISEVEKEPGKKKYSLALPGGFGSIQLIYANPLDRKGPRGTHITAPARWRIKYCPGTKFKDMVGDAPKPSVVTTDAS